MVGQARLNDFFFQKYLYALGQVVNNGPHGEQRDANSRVKDPLILGAATFNVLDHIAGQAQGIGGIENFALSGLFENNDTKSNTS